MRARLVGLGIVVAAVAGAVVVACDLEPDTHYGPHAGLSKDHLPTPPAAEAGNPDGGLACGTPVDAGTCTVSYMNDIWQKMTTTWKCTDATCHGANANAPYMLDNPDDAYNNLSAYLIGTKPYFNPCSTDPDASAFVCNVSVPTCGAAQMPYPNSTLGTGAMSGSDLTLVTTWVECGAPKN